MNPWSFLPESLTRPLFIARVPILWLSSTDMCFGDGAIVRDVRPEHITWLRSADGTKTLDEFIAAHPRKDDGVTSRAILRAALTAGMIDDAAFATKNWRWGTDEQRAECARLLPLIRRRWSTDQSLRSTAFETYALEHSIDARMETTVAMDPFDPLLNTMTAVLAAEGITMVDPHDDPSLFIGITRGHHALYGEPDLSPLQGHLLGAGEPHDHRPYLHVGFSALQSQVGPLVVPGHTACLRCAHLHERDRDKTWPLRAVQWSEHSRRARALWQPPVYVDPIVQHQAIAIMAFVIRQWVEDCVWDTSEHWADVVYRGDGLQVQALPTTTHPHCGCDWNSAVA